MSKEILMVAEAVSNEKGVSKEIIFEAIEQALAIATKKRYEEGASVRVVIDRETGDYESFRWWDVVADDVMAELGTQFTTEEAIEKDPTLKVGDTFEETIENIAFGRIAAQTAKQVIVQRVKDAERELIVNRFKDRVGELLSGTVKKVTRDHIVVDFGENAEGMLPREELVGREIFRINDRTRAILLGIREETRGPQLLVSRATPEMLIQLFEIEVPEISEGIIEIKAAARDPGQRGLKLLLRVRMRALIRLAHASVCVELEFRQFQMTWTMSELILSCGMIILHSWSSTRWPRQKSSP